MPQLQNLVLTDRKPTPVEHTFTPLDITNGVAEVVETQGVPIGNNRFTMTLKRLPATSSQSTKYRAQLRLTMPVVATEVINGVDHPKVLRSNYVDLQFYFDATSTEQERKDLVGMLMSSLDPSKTLVNDVLIKLQAVY